MLLTRRSYPDRITHRGGSPEVHHALSVIFVRCVAIRVSRSDGKKVLLLMTRMRTIHYRGSSGLAESQPTMLVTQWRHLHMAPQSVQVDLRGL